MKKHGEKEKRKDTKRGEKKRREEIRNKRVYGDISKFKKELVGEGS